MAGGDAVRRDAADRFLRLLTETTDVGEIPVSGSPWSTNSQAPTKLLRGLLALFDSVADQIRSDNDEVPTDVGAFLRVEDTDFGEVTGPAVGEEELAREDTTVGGQSAERIEGGRHR